MSRKSKTTKDEPQTPTVNGETTPSKSTKSGSTNKPAFRRSRRRMVETSAAPISIPNEDKIEDVAEATSDHKPDEVLGNRGFNVPGSMGITAPKFRRYGATNADTFIPLGMIFGHYLPVGQDSASELFPQIANVYLNGVLAKLQQLGYAQTYTVAELRTYYTGVSELLQMYKFVHEMRSLTRLTDVHTSPLLAIVLSEAVNGRLKTLHDVMSKTLSVIPYPRSWYATYCKSLGTTLLSDNPNSGMRMFAPKQFQTLSGSNFSANRLADAFGAALDLFMANAVNEQLSTILQDVNGYVGELATWDASPRVYNGDVVNNILNLPYWDAVLNAPIADDTTLVNMFFRRTLEVGGCLTFAPDDSILSVLQGTVWGQQTTGAEIAVTRVVYDNSGTAVNAVADVNLFQTFGTVWEAALLLEPVNSPSVTTVSATFTGIVDGVSSLMFT